MSTTFAFAVARRPRDVLGTLGLPDVSLTGGDPDGDWPAGVCRIYRRDVSTRSTEIDYDAAAQVVSIRMMSLASREDVALAVAFARAFAECGGGSTPVSAEGFGYVDLTELDGCYDDAWWSRDFAAGMLGLLRATEDGSTAQIPGPVRPFHVGPRVRATLADDPVRWLAALRALQWHPAPSAPVYTAKSAADGREIALVLWQAEPLVIPEVEYIAVVPVHSEGEQTILVRPASVPELAGASRCTHLDEAHLAIAAFTPIEWAIVYERAKKFESLP